MVRSLVQVDVFSLNDEISQLFKRNTGIKLVIMSLVFNVNGAYTKIQFYFGQQSKDLNKVYTIRDFNVICNISSCF